MEIKKLHALFPQLLIPLTQTTHTTGTGQSPKVGLKQQHPGEGCSRIPWASTTCSNRIIPIPVGLWGNLHPQGSHLLPWGKFNCPKPPCSAPAFLGAKRPFALPQTDKIKPGKAFLCLFLPDSPTPNPQPALPMPRVTPNMCSKTHLAKTARFKIQEKNTNKQKVPTNPKTKPTNKKPPKPKKNPLHHTHTHTNINPTKTNR